MRARGATSIVSSLNRSRASDALVATILCTWSTLRGHTARTSTLLMSPSASCTRSVDAANTGSPFRSMAYVSWPAPSCAMRTEMRVSGERTVTGICCEYAGAISDAASAVAI